MKINVFISLLLFSCIALAADTTAIEQALRDLDAQWSSAAAAKDLGKTVSFYSADAIVMPPNAPAATSSEAIRKVWQDLLASPGLVISWKLYSTYRELVLPEEAERYWKIGPSEEAKNVVSFASV